VSNYSRSTRLCRFGELQPELAEAIRAYAVKHELGDVEGGAVLCAETASTKKKKGLFAGWFGTDPDDLHHTAVVLTPERLIWARGGEESGEVVTMARLKEVEVRDFHSPLIEDTGLDVFGFVGGSTERVQAFIGLGPEPDAGRAAAAIKDAVAEAHE